MVVISKTWLEILSEFFVNIAAAWIAVVFIEPQLGPSNFWGLIFKFLLGILSLTVAKRFREEAKKYA